MHYGSSGGAECGGAGQRVRGRRIKNGLTLRGLEALTGVNIGHLSRIERGLCSPTERTLARIASGLGTDLGELLHAQES